MRLTAYGALFLLLAGAGSSSSLAQTVSVPPSPPPLIDAAPASNDDQPVVELPTPQIGTAQPAAAPQSAPAPVITTTQTADGVETESFEDWALECFGESATCQISHRVIAAEGSQVVVVLAILAGDADGPVELQLAVPLGVSTTSGVRLTIGNQYQANIPIARCTPQGCLVEGTVSDALMAAMRRGSRGQISVVNEAGNTIDLPFSLMGFTASFSTMIERNRANGS